MQDFKINTGEAIISLHTIKQFAFECSQGKHKEKNQKLFEQAVKYMPITELDMGINYRARIILPDDTENTGIIRENGIPINGYNTEHSGVAPIKNITKNGRVNRIGEQVLYLAEDIQTTCKEQKANANDYISVAECTIKEKIRVMDFTISVSDELNNLFSDETIKFFKDNHSINIIAFYIFIKEYLTSPNYATQEYLVPLSFLDIAKKRNDISGIKYNSFYTTGHNIALWDDNKHLKCTNSKVVQAKT